MHKPAVVKCQEALGYIGTNELESFAEWEKRQIEYENEWKSHDENLVSSSNTLNLTTSISLSNVHLPTTHVIPNRRRAVSDSVVQHPIEMQFQEVKQLNNNVNVLPPEAMLTLEEAWKVKSNILMSLDEEGIPVRPHNVLLHT